MKLVVKNSLLDVKLRKNVCFLLLFVIFSRAISVAAITDRIENSSIKTNIKKKTSHPLAFQLNSLSTSRRISRDIYHGKGQLLGSAVFYRNQEKIKSNTLVLNETNEKKRSFSRAGGRSKKKEISQSNNSKGLSTKDSTSFGPIKNIIQLILLVTIINNLFGFVFGGGNSNTVYYSSTVYEKTYYNENGELQRIRKENMQSNVPSLINNDKALRETGNSNLESFDDVARETERIFRATTIKNDLF